MKVRNGFVSNSSSSSFVITNTTDKKLTLVDFVKENPQLIEDFVRQYDWYKPEDFNQENLIKSAIENDETFAPNSEQTCIFGDEDGTLIGQVFDYILRDGGKSKSFKWRFEESLR
jgi:hypothetical protein